MLKAQTIAVQHKNFTNINKDNYIHMNMNMDKYDLLLSTISGALYIYVDVLLNVFPRQA